MHTIDVARFYHSLGINCIPWEHRRKAGGLLIPSWYEYQTRRVTNAEIDEWFSIDCGIAIVTGEVSGITVVDDDIRGGEKRLESSVVARSGGGGYHYYFRYTDQIKTSRRADLHLEIKNNGALIYAYPTIHESGNMYEFEKGIESLRNLGSFPLSHHLITDYQSRSEADHKVRDERVYTEGYTMYFNQGSGDRDNKLKELCLMLWKKNMSPGQVLSIARLANATYAPPLTEAEVKAKVDSTFRGLGDRQDTTIALARRDDAEPLPALISYKGNEIIEAYERQIESCGDGMSTGYADLDVFFKLYPKHLYMVTAGTHIGKTTFATCIGFNVARMGKKVTYFSLEDGLFITPKLQKLGDMPPTFTLVDCETFPTPSQIMNHIQEYPSDLVIVDHIHFLSSDDKKDSIKDTIIEITKNLKMLSKKLNIPIMSLVHIKKQDKAKDTPPLIDDMKDAQELGGLANVVCILHRKRLPQEALGDGHEYFESAGTLNVAKAKVPGGKTGGIGFGINDQVFTTQPYKAALAVIEGEE